MTDNEIIKFWRKIISLGEAKMGEDWECRISPKLAKETADMLNRQKAEIEKRQKETTQTIHSIRKMAFDSIKFAKSEAIKEFAELIKKVFPSIAPAIDYLAKQTTG